MILSHLSLPFSQLLAHKNDKHAVLLNMNFTLDNKYRTKDMVYWGQMTFCFNLNLSWICTVIIPFAYLQMVHYFWCFILCLQCNHLSRTLVRCNFQPHLVASYDTINYVKTVKWLSALVALVSSLAFYFSWLGLLRVLWDLIHHCCVALA